MSPAAVANLAGARCVRHPTRQAAARCPGCRRDYCRECVTEHGGRLLCQSCLEVAARRGTETDGKPGLLRRTARFLGGVSSLGAAVFAAWLAFYCLGRVLLLLPTGSAPETEGADPSLAPSTAQEDGENARDDDGDDALREAEDVDDAGDTNGVATAEDLR
jgi:hypothetical protein